MAILDDSVVNEDAFGSITGIDFNRIVCRINLIDDKAIWKTVPWEEQIGTSTSLAAKIGTLSYRIWIDSTR